MGRAPDLLQDLRLGHHPPGVAQQQRQQRVLLAGQRHRLAIQRHFTAHQVHVQVAVVEHRRGAVTGYAAGAQQRPYPRHQFLRAERLGDIVIGAGIQRPHLLGLAGAHAPRGLPCPAGRYPGSPGRCPRWRPAAGLPGRWPPAAPGSPARAG
ncbi:hypothetical protein G6F40_015379 [Rhizopus arrhizus]|nr:hypothetical protein G6F40_015379 [Rhizopus arrhizus]